MSRTTRSHRLLAALLLMTLLHRAHAAEYQFGGDYVDLGGDPLFHGTTHAFLWVPPHAARLRAVLLAPANIIERRVADDPLIRAEATRDGLAILFFQPSWGKGAMNSPNVARYIQEMLDRLAAQSGYSELSTVPWVPLGHSGNSQFVQAIGRLAPERTVTEIVIKGAIPAVGKDGSVTGLKDIPILFFTGEFEEVMPPGKVRNAWWGVSMQRFADLRAAVPDALISGMEDKDHGHIHWLPPMQTYLALYLHKVMTARLDDAGRLRAVAFASGWLADPDEKLASAPAAQYKGDPAKAFWFFDEEQARAWKTLFDHDEGKKEQLIAFTQDGQIAPWWPGWGLQQVRFEPEADGVTFKTTATFRDEVPAPFADAGTRLGHAHGGGPIEFSVVGWAGSTEQVGPNTFRVRFDREGFNGRTTHVLIGAIQHGDAEYRETVAVASLDLPPNNKGRTQTVRFPALKDQPTGVKSLPLAAVSDAGLPVQYYVSWGPAEVVHDPHGGDRLAFTPLPERARYPIAVRVTAYQWGRGTGPLVQTATPVTQTFYIKAPRQRP
jgi:hypothetical protein